MGARDRSEGDGAVAYAPRTHLSSERFYLVLGLTAIVVAAGLTVASWTLTTYQAPSAPFPATPQVPTSPLPVRVTVTSVVGLFDYYNGSHVGWLGTSGQDLNISLSEPGPPPYTFTGGQFLNWKIVLVNSASNVTGFIDNVSIESPGFTGAIQSPAVPMYFNPGQSYVFDEEFTVPYQNYTGSLAFWFNF